MIRQRWYDRKALRAELREFTQWWFGQLHEAVITVLRVLLPRWQLRALIELNASGGTVSRILGSQMTPLFSFHQAAGTDWPADLKPFGSVEVIRNHRAVVALDPAITLTYDITLPEATERTLDQVIPLYLEREFPLTLDRIAFDYLVVRRDREAQQIDVRLMIIQRTLLERILAAAIAWRVRTIQVGLAADNTDRCVGNFIRSTKRLSLRLSRLDKALMAGLIFLLVVTSGIVMGQWGLERYRVGAAIENLRPQAKVVQQAAQHLRALAAPAELLSIIAHQADAADFVEALTDVTPADTWISQLSIRAPALSTATFTLTAYTPPSLDYAKRLQSVMGMQQVKLVESTADTLSGSMKRIQLTASKAGAVRNVLSSSSIAHSIN